MQSAIRAIFPPQCLSCDTLTETDFGLCGACWAETPFLDGPVCDLCGAGLPGTEDGGGARCDDCLLQPRPWVRGRAALAYRDNGRRLALALKHGDRTDIARPAGAWLAAAAAPLLEPETLVVPVPLHWTRLVKRRFNQAALLARAMAARTGHRVVPDLLVRTRRTPSLGGLSREARFDTLADCIAPHPRRAAAARDRPVLLVDDVMTSGATLAAAAEAARAAGATRVCVLTLARAGKDA